MDLQTIFTKRFKQARKARGLTQEKLGIAIGLDEFVASTRINRYERGIHQPDFQILTQLAKVLDIPPAYFFADDELAAKLLEWHANEVNSNSNNDSRLFGKIIGRESLKAEDNIN